MKAKEYFAKYDDAIWEEAHDPVMRTDGPMAQMFIDFSVEMKDLIEQRNIKSDRAVPALIEELNQKWNAVVGLFEKKYGMSPIKRNAFSTVYRKEIGM